MLTITSPIGGALLNDRQSPAGVGNIAYRAVIEGEFATLSAILTGTAPAL
jgi:hypothetical protein